MLVLLPPSETKTSGGDGPPLDLAALSFPELRATRERVATELVRLAGDVPGSLERLGISARQTAEVERNAALRTSPTLPALLRYTGVLYDALDPRSLSRVETDRATGRVAVASALFGLVRAGDPIPAYRLSATSTLPESGSPRALWRPVLRPLLAGLDEFVVDLRSGPYAAMGAAPGAVTVRVVSTGPGGTRRAVSHHNKAYKGGLARALVRAKREPGNVEELVVTAKRAGIDVEQTGDSTLDLVADHG